MKNLIIMRGLPGSGKSYQASRYGGIACSSDDYFMVGDNYQFDPNFLPLAHAFNQGKVSALMAQETPLIVVDNTNSQLWEMQPYVQFAQNHAYRVTFGYPDTWWANDPQECYSRNKHGVPFDSIKKMKDRFEVFSSLQDILAAKPPSWDGVSRTRAK